MLADTQHSTHQADPALDPSRTRQSPEVPSHLDSSHPARLGVADFPQVPFRSMQTTSTRKDYKQQLLEKAPINQVSIGTKQQFGRATDSTHCSKAA